MLLHQPSSFQPIIEVEINTIEGGNEFLLSYIPKHNKQFAVCARNPTDVHVRPVPDDETLADILSIQSKRKLSKNLEIIFEKKVYQILFQGKGHRLQKSLITICQTLNGETHLLSIKGDKLDYKMLDVRTKSSGLTVDDKSLNAQIDSLIAYRKAIKPTAEHPWKRRYKDCE